MEQVFLLLRHQTQTAGPAADEGGGGMPQLIKGTDKLLLGNRNEEVNKSPPLLLSSFSSPLLNFVCICVCRSILS